MTQKNTQPIPSPQELKNRFLHACNLHQNNQIEAAVKAYEQLLTILPESSLLHFNLGLALFEQNCFFEAAKHYEKASELNPEDADIHYNAGLNHRRLNKMNEAVVSFQTAIRLGDKSIETCYNLALCHQDLHNYSESERLYETILEQSPDHESSLNNYAYLCHKNGYIRKAKTLYTRLLHLNPDHKAAKHMLNSLSGNVTETAPLEYVEEVFDNYAEHFEQSLLEELQYKTPKGLWYRFCKIFSPHTSYRHCLDMGCGTGLAGEQFAACCREITGIDISKEMLEIAEKKEIYSRLVKDDLLHFLQTADHCYDLIIAADVFTYMGNLEKLFHHCFDKTEEDGVFLFSIEESDSKTFELKQTGRFGHSTEYIEKLCSNTGWNILDCHLSKLRKDKDEWIRGHLYILQKKQTNTTEKNRYAGQTSIS